MAKEIFKRAEKKFLIPQEKYNALAKALEGRMEPDAYSRNGSFYTICNLYLDTADNYYIRQSLSHPLYKEKLRLRSYGTPGMDSRVYLDLKKKYQGTVHKRRTGIGLEDAYHFLRGEEELPPSAANTQVLEEIRYLLHTRRVEPRLYLSYQRQALFCTRDKELRITFDRNILTRRCDLRLEAGCYGDPLLQEDLWLMEVKAMGGLPLWLTQLLSSMEIYPSSFSKYGAEYQRHLYTTLEKGGAHPCLKPSLAAQLMPLSASAEQSLAS